MKDRITDEKLDRIMRTLISDAAPDQEMIEEIADSPSIWWAVQRNINVEKESAKAPWPPIAKLLRFAAVGIPVAAGLLFVFSYFFGPHESGKTINTGPAVLLSENGASVEPQNVLNNSSEEKYPIAQDVKRQAHAVNRASSKSFRGSKTTTAQVKESTIREPKAGSADEVKSEFIALSFARNPDSGQIVRVKVPRSMMVTLGLVASVDKPTSLVDAEVVVGDDGTTHSIRFIR